MAGEGVQHYLDLLSGLRRATRERAEATARGLLAQAGLEDAAEVAGERLGRLTDELQAARRANRELMTTLLSAEVEKIADQLGFARRDDIDELRREIAELRVGLAHQVVRTEEAMAAAESLADDAMAAGLGLDEEVDAAAPEPASKGSARTRAETRKSAATKTTAARTSAVKKTAANKTTAKKATAKATAETTAAKKATAKKATAAPTTATTAAPRKRAQRTAGVSG